MERTGILKKDLITIAHLPSLALFLGYCVYWLELYFLNSRFGRTSFLALAIFLSISVIVIMLRLDKFSAFTLWIKKGLSNLDKFTRGFIFIGSLFCVSIIFIACYAALLPPHLTQEFDALNYHLTIPRQHLIRASFAHLKWSVADLFVLPVDFALASYSFSTELPNKIPQFLFLLGLIAISVKLVKHLKNENFISIPLIVFAIIGSHFIGIQAGTAMLDIVICYLFLAALDSFLSGNIIMCAVEFTFFLWSKPFISLQLLFIIIIMIMLRSILKKIGPKDIKLGFKDTINSESKENFLKYFRKIVVLIILFSLFIGGPFLIKSTYYSGTPLFPFFPGIIKSNMDKDYTSRHSILEATKEHMRTKDAYGRGRSLLAFLSHLWLISVPEKGVNNKYDYPVGLMYLLFLGPFLYLFFRELKKGSFTILPIFIVVYWVSWWFGSQQTRFLYIPILLMMIVVSASLKIPPKVFLASMLIALAFTCLSVFRANRADFGRSKEEVLRLEDKELVRACRLYQQDKRSDEIELNYFDVAYACFPVSVVNSDSIWILKNK